MTELTTETDPHPDLFGQLADLGRIVRTVRSGRRILWLVGGLVAVIGVTAAAQILLNAWNQPFYDALTRKDFPAFVVQLGVFAVLAGGPLALNVGQLWLDQTLKLTLRRGIFAALLHDWTRPGQALRLSRAGRIGENPDQRLQADVDALADLTVALGVGLFQAGLLLFSFIGVLWQHSHGLALPIAGREVEIPGFMVWCALFYAGLASWLSWRVGRPLVAMSAERAAREADFRFEIVRVSEAAEAITLERGERVEARRIKAAFGRLVEVIHGVIRATVGLTWVTAGSGWFNTVAPILAAAPFYFSTDMTIGELMLVVGAFNQVQGALRWFINNFAGIANWRAILHRVISFHRALRDLAQQDCAGGPGRIRRETSGGEVEIAGLSILTPYVSVRLSQDPIRLAPGERLLLKGTSGSGKTILFRTLAGLWDRGAGRLAMPAQPGAVMYLPTRAYVPPGRLVDVLGYPHTAAHFSRAEVEAALAAVGLGHLTASLDVDEHWEKLLSESEKHCVSFARVILNRPQWLVMDDTLPQLDPEARARIVTLLKGPLAHLGLIDIGNGGTPHGVFTRTVEILAGEGVAL
ncbi:ABC transporter ATP-binding protein/permease [Rhodobacter capsulatus]|uniref:ABC transporter ATP-binding protein/permease n=1 Tax=Rhodobacter capsulatus TaxID=1061 RepID=UPI0040288FB9